MRSLINKTALIIFGLSCFISAQDTIYNFNNFNQSIGIYFNTGYNSFNLTDAGEYFERSLEPYRQLNLPMEAQTLYPSNILFGGGIYFFPVRSLSICLEAEFTKTKAYSLYGDNAGSIDIKSEIEFFSIAVGVEKHFSNLLAIEPYIGINAGIADGDYKYGSKIVFKDFPDKNYENEVTYSNPGFKAEAYIGASYNLDIIILSLQGGYKYIDISELEQNEVYREYPEAFPLKINASGFAFKLSLRSGIYW